MYISYNECIVNLSFVAYIEIDLNRKMIKFYGMSSSGKGELMKIFNFEDELVFYTYVDGINDMLQVKSF